MESSILCASSPELSVLATTIAIYIGEMFSVGDLSTIANFFNILGDTISLLATQKVRCEDSIKNCSNAINNSTTTTQNTPKTY